MTANSQGELRGDPRVKSLFGGPAPAEPVPEIVQMCQDLLAKAQSGELRGVAFATTADTGGGLIACGWHFAAGRNFSLAAALLVLHARFSNVLARGE